MYQLPNVQPFLLIVFAFSIRTLGQLEDDAVQCEAHIDYWKTNLGVMVGKEKQYNQQTANYKVLNFCSCYCFVNIV